MPIQTSPQAFRYHGSPYAHNSRQLAPAHHDFTHVGLPAIRTGSCRALFHQRSFHTIVVVLLFFVLQQMTGSLWRSAFVAALFAIHPLHVESVAWISERKDVLSAVFFMLIVSAYIRFVRAPSFTAYVLVLLFFALGLISKPMLVSVPFVLLLLDYWPLGRITHVGSPRALERQSARAASGRSYVVWWQMFWPVRLATFYPHPNDQLHLWQVFLAITFLIVVTLLAIHWHKERPYIFTGWFWYLGMLVPVIGLGQAGEQARTDRYCGRNCAAGVPSSRVPGQPQFNSPIAR